MKARAGVLLLALLCVGAGASGSEADTESPGRWVVLPESIEPYRARSLDAGRFSKALRHPETIEAVGRPMEKISGDDAGGDGPSNAVWRPWIEFQLGEERAFLPEALVTPWAPAPPKGEALAIGSERVDRTWALPLDYEPPDLTPLPDAWSFQTGRRHLLRREAAQALEGLFSAARAEAGLELRCVSSYRDAATQRSLYLRKIDADGLEQKTVAKPGHSEHQLGTTADVSGLDVRTVLRESFGDTPEGQWVAENAVRFGFRITYTRENAAETGYIPEPWHIRFMGFGSRGLASECGSAPDRDIRIAVPGGDGTAP